MMNGLFRKSTDINIYDNKYCHTFQIFLFDLTFCTSHYGIYIHTYLLNYEWTETMIPTKVWGSLGVQTQNKAFTMKRLKKYAFLLNFCFFCVFFDCIWGVHLLRIKSVDDQSVVDQTFLHHQTFLLLHIPYHDENHHHQIVDSVILPFVTTSLPPK